MVQFSGAADLFLGAALPRLLLQSRFISHLHRFPQLWDESRQKAYFCWLSTVLGKDEAREHCLDSCLQPWRFWTPEFSGEAGSSRKLTALHTNTGLHE